MTNKNAYAQSGVDVEAGYEVVERIKARGTQACRYRGALGGFGGMFDLSKQVSKSRSWFRGLTVLGRFANRQAHVAR